MAISTLTLLWDLRFYRKAQLKPGSSWAFAHDSASAVAHIHIYYWKKGYESRFLRSIPGTLAKSWLKSYLHVSEKPAFWTMAEKVPFQPLIKTTAHAQWNLKQRVSISSGPIWNSGSAAISENKCPRIAPQNSGSYGQKMWFFSWKGFLSLNSGHSAPDKGCSNAVPCSIFVRKERGLPRTYSAVGIGWGAETDCQLSVLYGIAT